MEQEGQQMAPSDSGMTTCWAPPEFSYQPRGHKSTPPAVILKPFRSYQNSSFQARGFSRLFSFPVFGGWGLQQTQPPPHANGRGPSPAAGSCFPVCVQGAAALARCSGCPLPACTTSTTRGQQRQSLGAPSRSQAFAL